MKSPSKPPFTIHDATDADVPGILDIFNHAILTTNAVWMEKPETLEERSMWFMARAMAKLPVLVARNENGDVLGYASYGPFNPRAGYIHTVEHSVYVRAFNQKQGVGSALLEALIERARADGKRVMVAAIDGGNMGSRRLHLRHGFKDVGLLPNVGVKWGKPLALLLMQLELY